MTGVEGADWERERSPWEGGGVFMLAASVSSTIERNQTRDQRRRCGSAIEI